MPLPTFFGWYHTDLDDLPDAIAAPWQKYGTQTPTYANDGLNIEDSSGVERHAYWKPSHPSDTTTGPVRFPDRMQIQGYVRGLAEAPAWASGASPIMLWLDDGARALGLSIGPTLRLVDPETGDIVAKVADNHPWFQGTYYRLEKHSTGRWVVYVDSAVVYVAAYDEAPMSTVGLPARYGFGGMDDGGTCEAVFEQVEVALNRELPPQWLVLRYFTVFPQRAREKWNDITRGMLRATVGLVQDGYAILRDTWTSLTADKIVKYSFYAPGDRLPNLESPAWGIDAPGDVSIQRERIRVDAQGAAVTGIYADFAAMLGTTPIFVEFYCGAKIMVRGYTPDANARVGPHIQIIHEGRTVTAQLIELAGSSNRAWVFTDALLAGPINITGRPWPVTPEVEHQVEVVAIGGAYVLLVIDGQIVDRLQFTDFPAVGAGRFARIENHGPGGAQCDFTIAHARAEVRITDSHRRPLFEQGLLERAVHVSGCETNAELDVWGRGHHEVQQLRGTTAGIIVEMKRLSCCDDVFIVADEQPASWVLERSWPEVTPVFLEVGGASAQVFIEFCEQAPNFSPQELADLAALYLVPRSAKELVYFLCVSTLTTGLPAAAGPGFQTVDVKSTEHFAKGDEVLIRTADNLAQETTNITDVPSSTRFEIEAVVYAFPADSVIRKVLART